jgi:hypothetical protein
VHSSFVFVCILVFFSGESGVFLLTYILGVDVGFGLAFLSLGLHGERCLRCRVELEAKGEKREKEARCI